MATTFRNKVVKDIGQVPILAIETDASTRTTVIGCNLANLTEGVVYASILVHDETSIEGYFIKDVMIPPNSSLRAISSGEKLILAPLNQVYVVSNENDSIDAIFSYVEIT